MNSSGGPLDFEAVIGTTYFDRAAVTMENRIRGLTGNIEKEASKMDEVFSRLGQAAAGYLAFNELSQLPGKIVAVRGEFQQLEIAFTTMLGSKEKSDQLLNDVVKLAATTPFGLKDAAQATKQLLAYGSASETVIDELRMLGDVAAGVSVPIGDLTYLYGTLRSQGRAYTVDIRQFAGRGIPIYAELAKVLGVSRDKVNELVESGKVGFPQVEQAFRNMSGAGGMFFNLMEKQSQSLTGLTSQLKDAFDIMFNDIGKGQQENLAGIIKFGISAVQNYQDILDILKVIIVTYGAYKAAVMAVEAVKAAEATSALAIATAVDGQSGSYARALALDVKRAQATASRTAALATQAAAERLNAQSILETARVEVSAAAASKARTLQIFRQAEAEEIAAQFRLSAAVSQQAATAQNAQAELQISAAKQVSIAENELLMASERRLAAQKSALAAGYDFGAKKIAVETAAKRVSSAANTENSLTTVANTAAKTANAIANTRLTAVQGLQIAVTRQLAAAQAAWNASLLSNPIVLTTVAIAALAGTIWALHDGTTATERAEKSLNQEHEASKTKREQLTAATNELTGVINSNTATQYAQLAAYQKLQSLYPGLLAGMSLQKFQLLETAEAQQMLNQSIDKMEIAKAQQNFEKATANVAKYKKQLDDLRNAQGSQGGNNVGFAASIEKSLQQAEILAQRYGKEVEANTAREWEANTPVREKIAHYEEVKESLVKQRTSLENNISSLKGMATTAQGIKPILDSLSLMGLNKQIDDINKKMGLLADPKEIKDGGNYAFFDKIKSAAVDAKKALGVEQVGGKEWIRLTKEIASAEKQLQKYSDKVARVKEKDKPQPFGSPAYYDQISRKATEALEKLNPKNVSEINRLQAKKLEAELSGSVARLNLMPFGSLEYWDQVKKNANEILTKRQNLTSSDISVQKTVIVEADEQAEKIRKERAVQSFQDELTEKKREYELYQKYIEAYGQDSAKAQFSSLITKDQDYVAYLRTQIAKLESVKQFTPLKKNDANNLITLNTELNEATGKETVMEAFQKDLDKAKNSAASLTEYLEVLRRKQDDLAKSGNSENSVNQRKEVAQEIIATEAARKNELKTFLQSVANSEAKRLEIQKHYDDLRAQLDVEYTDKKSAGYAKAMSDIGDAEKEELKEQQNRLIEQSKEYKAVTQVIVETGRDGIRKRITQQQDLVNATKRISGEGSEAYKKQLQELIRLQSELKNTGVDAFSSIVSVAGLLGEVLTDIGGDFGNFGSVLSGIASGAGNLQAAMKVGEDGKLGLDNYMAAAKGVIDIIKIITSSSKERKKAELEYYNSINAQQQQYNLALNDEIGIRSELSGSLFVNDYEGRLIDGIDKARDAQEKYNETLAKLDEGRAKSGQRNAVDWKAVGQGASSGAAVGAVIGSAIPVIGNVVGAAVGGIVGGLVGLFAGKKKKDSYTNLLDEYPELIQKSVDGVESLNVELAKSLVANNLVDESTKVLLNDTIAWAEAVKEANEQIESVIQDLAGSLGDDLRNALVSAFENGEDAAVAFGKSVGKVIENIVSQLLFQSVFGEAFKKLEDEMKASYKDGGDGSLIDDLERFFAVAGPLTKEYNEGLQIAKDQAKANGIDIFTGNASTKDPLSGQIAGATQETMSLLAGQFNAIRIYNANIDRTLIQTLGVMTGIKSDTARLASVEFSLISIDQTLKSMKAAPDPLRGKGL